MKKLAAVLIILALVATSAFASFIQIGPTGRFKGDITTIEDYKDISKYDIGADARINLGKFGVAANALIGKGELSDTYNFDSIITANFRLDFGLIDLAVGAGYSVVIGNDNPEKEWKVNDQDFADTLEVLKASDLLLRAAVGVNLGGIGASVDYKLPFDTVKAMFDSQNTDDAKNGQVSVSFLLNIF